MKAIFEVRFCGDKPAARRKEALTYGHKTKICLAVVIILIAIAAAFMLFQPEEEAPNDIALPVVMVNDKIYYCGLNKMAEAPDESQIAGRISDYTEPNTWPKTNDNTNVLCCVNQPYAFVDGELIVYAVNVHVNGKPIDYTVDGWFYCELYKPTYPDQ